MDGHLALTTSALTRIEDKIEKLTYLHLVHNACSAYRATAPAAFT